jgi:hypothetical protein
MAPSHEIHAQFDGDAERVCGMQDGWEEVGPGGEARHLY